MTQPSSPSAGRMLQTQSSREDRHHAPGQPYLAPRASKKGVKDFEFGRTLGEGSYSTVVAATDRTSGREYAVKILDKRHIIKEKKVKYVNIEKNTLNRLGSHPGIVRLYYTFQDEQSLYYVLDLAAEGELLGVLKRLGSFDEACTRFYASEILDAVEYMHSRGIIHRDLKPENVLLTDTMHIKITDFGTAKILEEPSAPNSHDALTTGIPLFGQQETQRAGNSGGEERAVSFVGTAEYVSPELLKDKHAGKASDLWAFGCILYQLLCGRPPFKAPNEYLTFQKIVGLQYEFPVDFPPIARDLIERLLVLDPARRLPIEHIKNHQFFDGVAWGGNIWRQKPPRLRKYTSPNPNPIIRLGSSSATPGIGTSVPDLGGLVSTSTMNRPPRSTTEVTAPSPLDLEWSSVLILNNERIIKLGNLAVTSTTSDLGTNDASPGMTQTTSVKDTMFSRLFGGSGYKRRNRLVLVTTGGRLILADTNSSEKRVKSESSLLASTTSWQMCQDGRGGASWRVSTVSLFVNHQSQVRLTYTQRDKHLTFEDVKASSPQWTQEWLDALEKAKELAVLHQARIQSDVSQSSRGNGSNRMDGIINPGLGEDYNMTPTRHHLTKGSSSMNEVESFRGKKRFSRRQSKSILAAVF